MEDGHCYIFCDPSQSIPPILQSRISFSFGVFTSAHSYPIYYSKPTWDTFSSPEFVAYNLPEFVDQCCKPLKLVSNLIFSIKEKYGFSASPFPRMPQKKLIEDLECLFPAGVAEETESDKDCPTATMQFCSFLPEATLQTLQSRGCTYFLKPSKYLP